MPRTPPASLRPVLVRAAGLLLLTWASGGAGCPNEGGGTEGPDEGSDSAADASVTDPSATDPSATDPSATDPSATDPSATDPSATDPSATDPSATDPSADSSATDPSADSSATDPSDTTSAGCLASGTYAAQLVDSVDPHGHTSFLKLWFAPDRGVDEEVTLDISTDGAVSMTIEPRASGTGEGHAGLAALVGTIDDNCVVDIDTTADFSSDTGPFGTIDVTVQGSFDLDAPTATMVLQGGGIPSGPIDYTFELVLPE